MGYYSPVYIGVFYFLAFIPLLCRKHTTRILLAGFLALSVFFAFTHAGNYYIASDAVQDISNKVAEFEYPYKEVWSSKDIPYYIAPPNSIAHVNLIPDINFFTEENILKNNVRYMAFYSTPDETKIKNAISEFCKNAYTYAAYGHTIGFVCEVDQAKIK